MATQLGMLIDTKRCIACYTCAVACKVENNLPNDIWVNQIVNVGGDQRDAPSGVYPKLEMSTYTLACQHCASPSCVAVCPTGSTYKREDGVVMQDNETCIGCKLCLDACPYQTVRVFLETEPKYHIDHAMGDAAAPAHHMNTVDKCTFCAHKLDRGEQPACIDVCPGRARTFGDLNDPSSDIAKKLAARDSEQLKASAGTNPSVYLLK